MDQLEGRIKDLLKKIMLEERGYLKEHPPRANSACTRDLLSSVPWRTSRCPR